ncbi:MAG: hypothetical protein NW224_23775 [Leptolyngbyaceae cyanobacterium bins.302]|nr:hypothetical protein [Leptolyngbyaceae cyanobacterium bins.302]
MAIHQKIQRRSLFPLTLAIAAGYALGALPAGMSPFIVEAAIKQFGFSEVQAGIMVSAELAALGLTAAASAIFIKKADLRLLGIAGAIVAGLGNLSTIFAVDPITFAVTRAFVGIGEGLAVVSSDAAASSNENYERLYSRAVLLTMLMMVALFVSVPFLSEKLPTVGTFAVLSGVAFSMIPSLLFMQRGHRTLEEQPLASSKASTRLSKIALMALIVALFTRLCETVFWAFNLQAATRSGYSVNDFGLILSLAMVLGLAIPWLVNCLSRRMGRIRLLVAIMLIKGISEMLLCQGIQPMFVVLQVLIPLTMAASGLCILQLLADIDSTGSIPALGIAVAMAAEALGPGLGGIFYSTFGLSSVGMLAMAIAMVTIVCAIALSKQLAQQRSGKPLGSAIAEPVRLLE